MKTTFILSLLLFFGFTAVAQQSDTNTALTPKQLTCNEILSKVSDKSLSIDQVYDYTKQIHHLPIEEQIAINEKILNVVKAEKDKAKLITIYAMLDNLFANAGRTLDQRRKNIEKGMSYIDQTANTDALGAIYYRAGMYYESAQEITTAHEHFYKAADCYNLSETKRVMLNFIYYKIGSAFYEHEDMENLAKIVDKMLNINFEGKDRIYYDNIYTFAAQYYRLKALKDENMGKMYTDSAIYYIEKSIDAYYQYNTTERNPVGATRMLTQNYYQLAELMLAKENHDLAKIAGYIEKGKEYMQPNDTSTLLFYLDTNAVYLLNAKRTHDAINELTKAEELIYAYKRADPNNPEKARRIYKKLTTAYNKTGDYQKALKYSLLMDSVKSEIYDAEKINRLKELSVKYETAQKDLMIKELQLEKEKEKQLKTVLIAAAALLITLALIVVLYNRALRLKKEKEASLLANRIKEKDLEFESIVAKTELGMMQSYLKGLEVERARLAKELHNNVSNELLSINIQIKEGNLNYNKITEQIEKLRTDIRNISHELMPPAFKYAGLVDTISDYISRIDNKDLRFSIELRDKQIIESLPEKHALEVYRIIQEAISNIVKHSKATLSQILIWSVDNSLALVIKDNGKGFDTGQTYRGIGLQIIRERVMSLNGQLGIVANNGCTIHIVLPLPHLYDEKSGNVPAESNTPHEK